MNVQPSVALHDIKAVIIDLDGTMVDTAADFHVAINAMRAELDLNPISLEMVKGFIGKGGEHLIRQVLAIDFDASGVEARLYAALQAYERHYLKINGDFSSIYPDVQAGLDEMRAQDLRLACVTNKPIGFARPLLEKLGLISHFEVIYGGDSLARKKPDPFPLIQVCSDFALAPQAVLTIGDSTNDAQAARAAGCPVLVVPYGYNHGHSVHAIDSDGIVGSLLDAARLLAAQPLKSQ